MHNHMYILPMRNTAGKVLFTLLLLCQTSGFATERYSIRAVEHGKMYFFMPCQLKGNAGSKLQYDMTLLSFSDSVSINMTLTSPKDRVKSVRLSADETVYSTAQYELYFQERQGSRFNTRIHIDCPIGAYELLFTNRTPVTIELNMESGQSYAFTYKAKKWQRESGHVAEVLDIIEYGKSREQAMQDVAE